MCFSEFVHTCYGAEEVNNGLTTRPAALADDLLTRRAGQSTPRARRVKRGETLPRGVLWPLEDLLAHFRARHLVADRSPPRIIHNVPVIWNPAAGRRTGG